MKAGIRQESALGPLLFVIVMDALTEDVRNGSLTELLHADNHALRWKSLGKVLGKYKRWIRVLEGKDLRVSVEKAKAMQLLYSKKAYVSKMGPCSVSSEWVSQCYLLFGVQNARCVFTIIVQMYLSGPVFS